MDNIVTIPQGFNVMIEFDGKIPEAGRTLTIDRRVFLEGSESSRNDQWPDGPWQNYPAAGRGVIPKRPGFDLGPIPYHTQFEVIIDGSTANYVEASTKYNPKNRKTITVFRFHRRQGGREYFHVKFYYKDYRKGAKVSKVKPVTTGKRRRR